MQNIKPRKILDFLPLLVYIQLAKIKGQIVETRTQLIP